MGGDVDIGGEEGADEGEDEVATGKEGKGEEATGDEGPARGVDAGEGSGGNSFMVYSTAGVVV